MSNSTNRVLITGGPLHGKTTRAAMEVTARGLTVFQCTDTHEQAQRTGRTHPSAVYALDSLDADWSGLSQWVAGTWLQRPGPWVMEGVALPRALRKYRAAMSADDPPPPCDQLIWLCEPRAAQTGKQASMTKAHDSVLNEVLDSWPALRSVLVLE